MTEESGSAVARTLIADMFAGGIAFADPRTAVRDHVRLEQGALCVGNRIFPLREGRVLAVAIGKAAFPMAQGLVDVLGATIDAGIVLTKDGHLPADAAANQFELREASHPVPDARGVEATREVLDLVSGLGEHDTVIALISGGGSALFEAPAGDLALSDIQGVTTALLRAGAPIQDLNAVRSELSLVKGWTEEGDWGGALRLLILSDVLGNDPTVIASGPTIAREPNPKRALDLLTQYRALDDVPAKVARWLESKASESVPATVHADDVWAVMADNASFVESMAEVARAAGHHTKVVWHDIEGEAGVRGSAFVELCTAMPEDVDVVLGGGETTVTVRGDGIGGRNTEFALAAAIALRGGNSDWMIASLASDGDDGANRGAAGAVVDSETVARGGAHGLDASDALRSNDSGTFLAATGDLFRCDPTGTNVNDAYVGVRLSRV